jgi:hypothetical protein
MQEVSVSLAAASRLLFGTAAPAIHPNGPVSYHCSHVRASKTWVRLYKLLIRSCLPYFPARKAEDWIRSSGPRVENSRSESRLFQKAWSQSCPQTSHQVGSTNISRLWTASLRRESVEKIYCGSGFLGCLKSGPSAWFMHLPSSFGHLPQSRGSAARIR